MRRAAGLVAIALLGVVAAACGGGTEPRTASPAFERILILGNSITLHGPSPEIGWIGNWGMAATSASRDYSHLVAARVSASSLEVRNISGLETDPDRFDVGTIDSSLAHAPELVIIELGDNAHDPASFAPAYAALVAHVAAVHPPTILCLTTWWGNDAVDDVVRRTCAAVGARVVEIGSVYLNPMNRAGFERRSLDPGVAIHPGDSGMARLADAIVSALRP